MVAIHINANYIFCKPMKYKTESEIIAVYQQIVNRMRTANLGLTHHRLDNEASTAFKECIRDNGMTHKLVPLNNHRHNLAERAIQTFKHHIISRSGRQTPTIPLVSPSWPSRTHPQPTPPVKRCPKDIGLCPCPWPT